MRGNYIERAKFMPYKDEEKIIKYHKTLRQKRKNAGLCVRCGGPRTDIRITCNFCASRENGYVKNTAANHIASGRCRCGKNPIENKSVCQICSDYSARCLRELKFKVFAGYGDKCSCCGISEWEFLSIDHVEERGCDERKRLGSKATSGSFYRKIIAENFPPSYRLLCFNCNLSLGFFGYCPHHPEIRRSTAKLIAP
jgi:hypothetical protein